MQAWAAQAVQTLAAHAVCRTAFAEAGVLAPLAELLFSSDQGVQEAAAGAVSNLARNSA